MSNPVRIIATCLDRKGAGFALKAVFSVFGSLEQVGLDVMFFVEWVEDKTEAAVLTPEEKEGFDRVDPLATVHRVENQVIINLMGNDAVIKIGPNEGGYIVTVDFGATASPSRAARLVERWERCSGVFSFTREPKPI